MLFLAIPVVQGLAGFAILADAKPCRAKQVEREISTADMYNVFHRFPPSERYYHRVLTTSVCVETIAAGCEQPSMYDDNDRGPVPECLAHFRERAQGSVGVHFCIEFGQKVSQMCKNTIRDLCQAKEKMVL